MKKLLAWLFAFLLPLTASCEAVRMPLTQIVGHTGDGEYIHAYPADNGQTVYFTALDENPSVTYEDVNFDGVPDLVCTTSTGVSNAFCEYFVYQDGLYVQAEHPGMSYGLCNYVLYPEYGLVFSHANNGFAGALFESCLFAWDGTDLRIIRRSAGELLTETAYDGETQITTSHHDTVHFTVHHYTPDRFEGFLTFEQTASIKNEEEIKNIFTQMDEVFWKNIK